MFDPLIKYSSKRRGLALVVAAVATLTVIATAELAYSTADNSMASIRGRHAARLDSMELRGLLVDAETAQRGFLLTGRDEYLEPLVQARKSLNAVIGRLKAHYRSSEWDALVSQLQQRVLERISEMDMIIEIYRRGDGSRWADMMRTNIGKEKMDAVREATNQIEVYESDRIQEERADVNRAMNVGRFGVHALAALALLGFAYFLRKNEAFDRARAEHAENLRAERDRLDSEVSRRTEELTELARHLTTVREDERGRLARELHDELGALLTAAKLDLARARRVVLTQPEAAADRLEHMSKLIDEGITLKRRIIEDLRPSALTNLGLVPSLTVLTREFAERSGLTVHTELVPVATDPTGKLAIYRLIQEALTNVLRHAEAKTVWVRMRPDGEQMIISVQDDGKGFDAAQVGRGHHGLLGMRYRIEALGGVLRTISAPGQGTDIEAHLPFKERVPS